MTKPMATVSNITWRCKECGAPSPIASYTCSECGIERGVRSSVIPANVPQFANSGNDQVINNVQNIVNSGPQNYFTESLAEESYSIDSGYQGSALQKFIIWTGIVGLWLGIVVVTSVFLFFVVVCIIAFLR